MNEMIAKTITDNLPTALISVLGGVMLWYLKILLKQIALTKKKHPLSIVDMGIYGDIISLISTTRVKTDAARCYIISIRNGDVQINNLHQYKLYCDYEVVEDGVSRMKNELQGIPVQDVYDYVSVYYKKQGKMKGLDVLTSCDCMVYDYSKIDNGTVKQMMISAGAGITIHSVIRNSTGDILGVLCVDFCSDKYVEIYKNNSPMLLSYVNMCRDRLQQLLRTHNANRS